MIAIIALKIIEYQTVKYCNYGKLANDTIWNDALHYWWDDYTLEQTP